MILSSQIRKNFIDYFKRNGHRHFPSSPVIPHEDPTLLFTNAGMNQFKDLFLGKTTADFNRAVTSQKCVRVGGKHNDLDNVGHTSRHMTFFEMLGNFSFGNYFKEEAIRFAFEVSMEVLQFDFDRLWVTVFQKDDEAYELWKKWVPEKRIVRLGEKDNFWAMGDVGPCGPCSELYFDRGEKFGTASSILEDTHGERYLEFWNLVFMQYNRHRDGKLENLPNQSIDTGAGLERVVSLKMGVDTVFGTDIMQHLIHSIESLTPHRYDQTNSSTAPAFHVIADHLRTLCFAIADGATPSNVDRGYVLRKILRRAVRYGKRLDFHTPFLARLVPSLIDAMGQTYGELSVARGKIEELLTLEEETFHRTLKRGGNILNQVIDRSLSSPAKEIHGHDIFKLKDTYGFPLEEIMLMAKDTGLQLNLESFTLLEEEAKERSRKAQAVTEQMAEGNLFQSYAAQYPAHLFTGFHESSTLTTVVGLLKNHHFTERLEAGDSGIILLEKTPFYAEKGGQVGDQGVIQHHDARFQVDKTSTPYPGVIAHHGRVLSGVLINGEPVNASIDQERRRRIEAHHTATHLLHLALQDVLGAHVAQAGSLVDHDRLRFDFHHHKALTEQELQLVEDHVNARIKLKAMVTCEEKPYEQVKSDRRVKQFFGEKYGAVVRIVKINDESLELCGGTHAASTGDLILFKIVKESSIGAGIRRIEAATSAAAIELLQEKEALLKKIEAALSVDASKILAAIATLHEETKLLKKDQQELKALKNQEHQHLLLGQASDWRGIKAIVSICGCEAQELSGIAAALVLQHGIDICLIAAGSQFFLKLSKNISSKGIKAGDWVKQLHELLGCQGGGKEDFAQGKITRPENLNRAKQLIEEWTNKL